MDITRIGEKNSEYFIHLTGGSIPRGQSGLGVIMDGRAVAAAIFDLSDGICTLEHLYVDEKYRKKGVGSFLLKDAIEAFKAAGVDTMMVYYTDGPGITEFLQKHGFACAPSISFHGMSCAMLMESEGFQRFLQRNRPNGLRKYKDFSIIEKRQTEKLLKKAGFDSSIMNKDNIDLDLSFGVFGKKGVMGCALLKIEDGDILVSGIYSHKSLSVLEAILCQLTHIISENATAESQLIFTAGNEKLMEVLQQLTGEKVTIESLGDSKLGILQM